MEPTLDNDNLKPEKPAELGDSIQIVLITFLASLVIFFVYQLGQMPGLILGAYLKFDNPVEVLSELLSGNVDALDGDLIGYGAITGGLLGILACYLAAKLSRIKIQRVFPMKIPNLKQWTIWIISSIAVFAFIEFADSYGDYFDVPFMDNVLATISQPVIVILGVGILAPICEELLFRGVLYKGIRDASSENLAVWVSSFLFVFIHLLQYSFAICMLLLPLGLLLGFARKYSKSMIIPIVIHVFNNTVTAIQGF